MDTKNNLADNLKKLRIASSLSQEKLSAKADISPRYYQKIERGISTPSVDIIFKIARGLEIEYTDILNPIWADFKDQNSNS